MPSIKSYINDYNNPWCHPHDDFDSLIGINPPMLPDWYKVGDDLYRISNMLLERIAPTYLKNKIKYERKTKTGTGHILDNIYNYYSKIYKTFVFDVNMQNGLLVVNRGIENKCFNVIDNKIIFIKIDDWYNDFYNMHRDVYKLCGGDPYYISKKQYEIDKANFLVIDKKAVLVGFSE